MSVREQLNSIAQKLLDLLQRNGYPEDNIVFTDNCSGVIFDV